MEKNGNTLAPGDSVVYTGDPASGTKLASSRQSGTVVTVDIESEQALVKFAHYERLVPLGSLERQ